MEDGWKINGREVTYIGEKFEERPREGRDDSSFSSMQSFRMGLNLERTSKI